MAHEDTILSLMASLVVADKHDVSTIMAARDIWKPGTSSVNNSYKALSELSNLGKLEKGDGFFRLPGCRSEYKEHAQLITKFIVKILIQYPESIIHREHEVKPLGLRADAIALLIKESKGRCAVIEAVISESPQSVVQKMQAWTWEGAKPYLSKLFGYAIPYFELVTSMEDL